MSSLTEQYRVFKFRQEFVDNLKEHNKDRRDSQSHSASESDGGSSKSDSNKGSSGGSGNENATNIKVDAGGNSSNDDVPASSCPPLGLAITTPGEI